MNYRTVLLNALESHATDVTKVIDININDPISNIVILLGGTNTAHTMTGHYMSCLPKIEVVDGSDVLFSLDGFETEALDWYHNSGKFRSNWNWAFNTGTWDRAIALNFGRHLWDPVYALDPKMFNNLQLRISLDINGGGNANTPLTFKIFANVFDDKVPALKGFLTTKEIKQWTMASTQHEYTDLPTDHPYRALYVRAFKLGTESNVCLNNFKLSEDQDKKVPFDLGGIEICRTLLHDYPRIEEFFYIAASIAKKYVYCAATQAVTAYATHWQGANITDQEITIYNGDGGRLDLYSSVNANIVLNVQGNIPHCIFEIPFGQKNDPDDAYVVSGINSLRADITGGTDSVGHLIAQQYRSY
ncbi:hypothetical protein LCGC14_2295550 [marine sediment metagenome]|uniref:Uncharacterized protein n=1 Tax=marine sediment metagenome TaxID=412755 RepID=A0A0F9CPZ1_9ZZZZ